MAKILRIVVDTNILISAMAFDGSPRHALDKTLELGVLLFSEATSKEWREVLERPKFDIYLNKHTRQRLYFEIITSAIMVQPKPYSQQCRDPKDQKFLEAYIGGEADYLITGDRDLLVMKNRELRVLTAEEFLQVTS